LAQDITIQGTLTGNNRIVDSSSNKTVLSFSTSSGTFSGRVADPNSRNNISYSGIADQGQNTASGYYLSQGMSGPVSVTGQ
jgi:hypothetical protein